jgi:NADH dehydrogenase FAD-containing subunit
MLFTPMLPEAASGTLEPRHVVVPIRVMCPHSDLVLGRAVAHDGGGRCVQVETEETVFWIRYDNLVVALGAVARTLPIPGLADHALGFKSLSDAIHLRNPRPHAARGRRHALLLRRGVDIRVATTLEEVEPHAVRLSDGAHLLTSTVVWTAGVKANPFVAELGLPLDDRGRVRVDGTLRVEGTEHVWAPGDCAAVPNTATPGRVDPPTSQHALRQAKRLARNVAGEMRPYRYRTLSEVVTLGRYKGIANVFGFPIKGFLGWWVTRTYHLYQLPLLSRKLRVVTDWTVALFFRRDIAELGVLDHPRRLGD